MASPFQFSMRQLLVAVAFVALGTAALLNANIWWHSAVWTLVMMLLSSGILLAIYRREGARAFWVGFLVFGWIYFGVVMYVHIVNDFSTRTDPLLAGNKLVTTRVTEWIYTLVIPEARRNQYVPDPSFQGGGGMTGGMAGIPGMPGMGAGPGGMPMGAMPGGGTPGGMMFGSSGPGMAMGGMGAPRVANPNYVDLNTFVVIAHALWLVLLAALGGKLAQWMHRSGVRNQESGAS